MMNMRRSTNEKETAVSPRVGSEARGARGKEPAGEKSLEWLLESMYLSDLWSMPSRDCHMEIKKSPLC